MAVALPKKLGCYRCDGPALRSFLMRIWAMAFGALRLPFLTAEHSFPFSLNLDIC
jgi:hypothetical protein